MQKKRELSSLNIKIFLIFLKLLFRKQKNMIILGGLLKGQEEHIYTDLLKF